MLLLSVKTVCDVMAKDVNAPERALWHWGQQVLDSPIRTIELLHPHPDNTGCIWAVHWGAIPGLWQHLTCISFWKDPSKISWHSEDPGYCLVYLQRSELYTQYAALKMQYASPLQAVVACTQALSAEQLNCPCSFISSLTDIPGIRANEGRI